MSSLTAQQTSNDGSAKAFIITQAASRFENIALQYLKLQEPDTSEETIQSNEIKNKLSSYKELIQAANNEMEHKMHLLEIQKRFEIQRADEEFEEFLDYIDQSN
ncbi:hypothetical protein TVAG_016310 [Trichomonas vaginalis G3]|uniref:Uncharacterized protein n=1 Tax=Trichomonas vaginalis (strain ATCC PRA-98 / G3) TaxID=412133 RepID=A2DPA1_TRIV3|nr:hypothetical protein TVAGG3_0910290 [Trichomonas vaginalis G3]EAY17801.1 hypothetical protein TVAG_016310 [Trichomonas vaginalis G3]KAI5484376.1 hypothetical protein TVAGG3_0910290 [Trichomonas vaginalis G3]|eukprot:XP_001329936.1 hypothetical protein [Trichomonas vaginalis G3]